MKVRLEKPIAKGIGGADQYQDPFLGEGVATPNCLSCAIEHTQTIAGMFLSMKGSSARPI